MNAKEAWEVAIDVINNKSKNQYTYIKNNIQIAAEKGEFFITWSANLYEDVKQKLKEEGFTIGPSFIHNPTESIIDISWKTLNG